MKDIEKTIYNHKEIEKKWQDRWAKEGLYKTNILTADKPYYNLMMYPYPSAEGLHVGHVFAFGGADIHGRYKRMNGYDVFEPMGFDSGGIHSENFAIKMGIHPKIMTERNIANFTRQLKRMGNMFDWDHSVEAMDPNYYKWTQWIFTRMFKAGLAYKKPSPVTWCPSCKTTVSDEQTVQEGEQTVCERCKTPIERRFMNQWFLKITEYAERLLENTNTLDWPNKILATQRNWIGKSEGALVRFETEYVEHVIEVFTTRPDTLHGCTYMVLAPEHPLVPILAKENYKDIVQTYADRSKSKTERERKIGDKEKTGVFTGAFAINPVNKKQIPIWVADYVLMGYGEGAVMGVPAHDERDFDFAQKYGLEIIPVIKPLTSSDSDHLFDCAYSGPGSIINSNEWNAWSYPQDASKVLSWLVEKGIGEKKITYKLRDWNISRQRYWGPPIPMIHCEQCEEEEKGRTVLILHSWYGNNQENWIPWLKRELEDRGYKTLIPNLPDNRYPDYAKLMMFLETEYKDQLISGQLAVIGHSLGGYLAIKLAEKYKLARIVAVAPAMQQKITDFPQELQVPYKKELTMLLRMYHVGGTFNTDLIQGNVNQIAIFYSNNDPYINKSNQDIYKVALPAAHFSIFINRGHFGSKEQCKRLPEILSYFNPFNAGWYPVPDDQLPVLLPDIDDYLPDGSGKAPLERHPEFYETTCPSCGGIARRETDVSDTFLDSSWYFLRYPSTEGGDVDAEVAKKSPFDISITKKWLPVTQYCGGAEHSVLHLMYSRFITMALHDMGYLDFEEPFPRFYAHGLIIKDGAKMSKSRGNVIDPDEYIDRFGVDTMRLYMAFMGPYSDGGDFRDTGIAGMQRFVNRLWNRLYLWQEMGINRQDIVRNLEQIQHQTIYKVTQSIENFKYNTAISALMEFLNALESHRNDYVHDQDAKYPLRPIIDSYLQLLAPFAPHISEELWQIYNKTASSNYISVHQQAWPRLDKLKMQSQTVTIAIQVNGKMRGTVDVSTEQSRDEKTVLDMVLQQEAVQKYITGSVQKHIFVPGKLVNLIV